MIQLNIRRFPGIMKLFSSAFGWEGGCLIAFGGIRMSGNPGAGPVHLLTIEESVSPEGTLTLVCRGRLTLETATQFRSEVKSLASQHKLLLADLSAVHSVDSAGLGSIFGTYISAKSQGCDLVLVNVHPRIKDLLNITNLTRFFAKGNTESLP